MPGKSNRARTCSAGDLRAQLISFVATIPTVLHTIASHTCIARTTGPSYVVAVTARVQRQLAAIAEAWHVCKHAHCSGVGESRGVLRATHRSSCCCCLRRGSHSSCEERIDILPLPLPNTSSQPTLCTTIDNTPWKKNKVLVMFLLNIRVI